MLSVKNMSANDVAFAASLTDTMNWNLTEEDFKFMMKLEPEGCFVLFHDSERIGVVTTINFDKIGWLGNLIISEQYRKKGAGSLLANHAIKYLKDKGVETVGLYAYIDKVSFYERLGFVYDSNFVVIKGESFYSPSNSHIIEGQRTDVQRIIEYDCSCLGFSRGKLLKLILTYPSNLFYLYVDNEEIMGYVIAKVYHGTAEIGPLVCHLGSSEVAISLLKAVLSKLADFEVFLCTPERQTAFIKILKQYGFSESFRVARMFHGPPFNSEYVYMAESLERG